MSGSGRGDNNQVDQTGIHVGESQCISGRFDSQSGCSFTFRDDSALRDPGASLDPLIGGIYQTLQIGICYYCGRKPGTYADQLGTNRQIHFTLPAVIALVVTNEFSIR